MEKAILRTLVYADVFDYPLLASEVWGFLIKKSKLQIKIQKLIQDKKIEEKEGFYFLPGRKRIVAIRKKRERWSQKKMKIARRTANWLKLIPTIKMVAVSGALAMKNSTENDDIDLLIVTAKKRLWLTRLFSVFLIELVGQRRRPSDKMVRNKICLNMFLDETHLRVPKKEQDLFTAHEICQLKLLWERGGIYQKFINQNQWYQKYLANWRP